MKVTGEFVGGGKAAETDALKDSDCGLGIAGCELWIVSETRVKK